MQLRHVDGSHFGLELCFLIVMILFLSNGQLPIGGKYGLPKHDEIAILRLVERLILTEVSQKAVKVVFETHFLLEDLSGLSICKRATDTAKRLLLV